MKKYSIIAITVITSIAIFLLGFGYKRGNEPKTYYQVYLNDEVLGVITSKSKLEKYINSEGTNIKKEFKVDTVYAPKGLQIKKVTSFESNVSEVNEVYDKIIQKAPFTIKGYQISIKKEDKTEIIYVTKEKIFNEAATKLIETFVGKEEYQKYLNNSQSQILETGALNENIYIEESKDWTIKETQIPVDETIYSDPSSLSKFLLFGTIEDQKKYIVKSGDTIEDVIYNNQISKEEFFISNPDFTSENNLLFPGQEIVIGETNPQLSVVTEKYVVSDIVSKYKTVEKIDETKLKGDNEVTQKGQNGLDRVSQREKSINGAIVYVEPISKQEIKSTIEEIIVKGDKNIPNVGSTKNWGWPTDTGYTITQDFAWRINPITKVREHHSAIDIAGLGYNANIYASNNGTIITATYSFDYGNYVVIDHNNGYYTLYSHMSRFASGIAVGNVVARGQLLGYIGTTGYATGPHLHYEVWLGCKYCRINPWSLYK